MYSELVFTNKFLLCWEWLETQHIHKWRVVYVLWLLVYYVWWCNIKLVNVLFLFYAGPVAVGQFHRSFRRDSLSPYSYVSTSSHNHSTFPLKGLDRTPIPPRTWQNSLGMHPGQVETSPTFSDKGVPFPVLQRFPTEVTYTLQPSATSVHVQQGPQTMVSSSQKYSNYTPSAQYSQAYYPTGMRNSNSVVSFKVLDNENLYFFKCIFVCLNKNRNVHLRNVKDFSWILIFLTICEISLCS